MFSFSAGFSVWPGALSVTLLRDSSLPQLVQEITSS